MVLIFVFATLFLGLAASFEFKNTNDGSDLNSFVSRPDLRPPLYEVTVHNADRVNPGFWFVAPYEKVSPDPLTKNYQPCQIGPQIYDNDGNLVWSGACQFHNRNAYNFQTIPGSNNLSVNYGAAVENDAESRKGMGLVMSPSFEILKTVRAPRRSTDFDLHEFRVIGDGKKALYITNQPALVDISSLGKKQKIAWVKSQGFQEVDVEIGHVDFEWIAMDHLDLSEGWKPVPSDPISPDAQWDVFHINSIDKDIVSGNYLVSCRGTNTIYLVSGTDGSIIWRLGQNSSFTLVGSSGEPLDSQVPFYGQHDPRFLYCVPRVTWYNGCKDRSENDGKILISVFDNGAISNSKRLEGVTASSSILLLLDTSATPMTAQVIERHVRPDATFSWTRGNAQYLDNGNVFVGWSIQGYVSEHYTDAQGVSRCAMEAKLKSDRMGIYRSYKFNFTGEPSEPIALKTFVHEVTDAEGETVLSTFYVSWNGATEVSEWAFYLGDSNKTESTAAFSMVGSTRKSGFETQFSARGYAAWSFVEAIGKEGQVLGRSEMMRTVLPQAWAGKLPVDSQRTQPAAAPATTPAQDLDSPSKPDPDISQLSDQPVTVPPPTTYSSQDPDGDSTEWQTALGRFSTDLQSRHASSIPPLLLLTSFLVLLWILVRKLRRRRKI